uniref:inositol-pentakisphosphate 2-kinase n=1 Tax=Anopheles epiroticus TaxID=199890 RepID=A0A182PJ00_9DIPT
MGKINASHSSYCYDSVLKRSDDKYLRSCARVEPIEDPNEDDDDDDDNSEDERQQNEPQDRRGVAWREEKLAELGSRSSGASDDEREMRVIRYLPEIRERIDENRLVYRAEGNANIVLSLSDNKHVLRMRKSTVETREGKGDSNVDLRRFVKYSQVIASQFSPCYVPAPKLAHLNTYNLQAFNERLRCFRPAMRLGKEIRELDGILYPDVAFLPKWLFPARVRDFSQDSKISSSSTPTHYQTYCVEIKPKQGWLAYEFCDNIPLPPELTNDGDLRKCRYCLHQYLKLQKKSIAKISKYCPLDLYSGKPVRVLQAVKGLIGAPQNNFKILKNGKVVYDDKREKSMFNRILREMFPRDGRTKDERSTIFMNLIKEILLKDFTTNDENSDRKLLNIKKDRKKKDKNQLHERACSPVNQQFLPQSCALRQILDVQLLVKSTISTIDPSKLNQSRSDPYGYIDEMYEKYLNYQEDAVYEGRSDRTTWPKSSLCSEYLSEEEKYQLGATALDCSIMITFRRLSGAEENSLTEAARNHIVSIEGMKFVVNVTITDLDPKSPKHYAKYVEQLATMGNKVVTFTDQQLEDYQDCTFFTRKEILRVHQRFHEASPDLVPVIMTEGQASTIQVPRERIERLPELVENPFKGRMCEAFSRDGDGNLTFEDFLDLLSVFSEQAPRDIKVYYAFKIYDYDRDGFIGQSDLLNVITALTRNELSLEEHQQIAEKVIEEADVDGDGKLSYLEFEHVITRAPDFISTFHIRI